MKKAREILENLADKVMFRQMEFYKDTNVCMDVCRDRDDWVESALKELKELMPSEDELIDISMRHYEETCCHRIYDMGAIIESIHKLITERLG